MKIEIQKHSNGRLWVWRIRGPNGYVIKTGYQRSRTEAESDAKIQARWLQKDKAQ